MDSMTENLSAENNVTDNSTAGKVPTSIEGICVAYGSLVIMAVFPIFFGSIRSVKYHKDKKASGEKADVMSSKDAVMFPLIASCALFGLYIFFKIFSKDYINLLLTGYFFFLGIMALSNLLSPIIGSLIPTAIPKIPFHMLFTQGEDKNKKDIINYKFSSHDIGCLIISVIVGVWYLFKKHWIANNLFGLAFAVNGVELLHLNNVITGCILLSGLFIYDIFWVFGTDVMVTVAKSFEAPIKLVFPQDLLVNGLQASNFAMLGLGDIVIPGIFIALLLRFDHSLKRRKNIYFYSTIFAYLLGLIFTILVMHMFKHAQPALLYLVPVCITTPTLIAFLKGDLKQLFAYEDHPEENANKEVKETKKKHHHKSK